MESSTFNNATKQEKFEEKFRQLIVINSVERYASATNGIEYFVAPSLTGEFEMEHRYFAMYPDVPGVLIQLANLSLIKDSRAENTFADLHYNNGFEISHNKTVIKAALNTYDAREYTLSGLLDGFDKVLNLPANHHTRQPVAFFRQEDGTLVTISEQKYYPGMYEWAIGGSTDTMKPMTTIMHTDDVNDKLHFSLTSRFGTLICNLNEGTAEYIGLP